MSERIKDENKPKYSLLSNLLLLYREQIKAYPKVKWLVPVNIITQVIIPFIGTLIPAVAVSIITGSEGAGYFVTAVGGIVVIFTVLNFVQKYTDVWINQINLWMRCNDFFKALLMKSITTDYDNVEPQKQQKLIEKAREALNSNWDGVEIMYKSTPIVILNFIGMLGYGTVILALDVKILIILVLMTIFNFKLNDYARNYMSKHWDEEVKLHRTIDYLYGKSTTLENGKDVRIYQMEGWFKKVFDTAIKKINKLHVSMEKRWYLPVASDTVFSAVRDFAAYIILINLVLDGRITLSVFTLYIGIIAGFSNWLFGFVNAYADLKRGSLQVGDFRYMLEFPDKFKRKDGLAIPSKDMYPLTIEFKNVCFRYEGAEEDTLSHINLTIRAGESVALVGHNGAGKTTIVKLLCGFYHPTSGEILVGGHPISAYNIDEYYKLIGAVFQEIKPLAFTVAQCVSGSELEETDMDKVRESLKAAGLYDKIESLKEKEMTYITQVFSEKGIQLSGGETQKLMLARAIYKDAPIMILDEPTAALDPIAESAMYEEYNKLTADKTSIFISHRLASTRFCDKIVFLEKGRIVEKGTHEELIKKGRKYAEVYEIQSHYYKESNKNEEDCSTELNEGYAV
jgi:ATP-binding cassette subfamily B protein